MAEPREKALHELLSRDMVDIYVGEENTHWILHEKLLCHRSKFFRNIFSNKKGSKNSMYGLPDEGDEPFKLFVGWLYADSIPQPTEEKELSNLFDLYLMAEKWEIKKLTIEVLETVRKWYHDSDTWPGLRRVQYIYANTEYESPMRQLLVSCVARMLVVGDTMPPHWEKALRKNGQLAVDIIMCVQKWHIEPEKVPDTRDTRRGSIAEMVDQAEDAKAHNSDKNEVNGGAEEPSSGGDEESQSGEEQEAESAEEQEAESGEEQA
ncbi:hypothetical protein LTR37_018028 [Vermiconidia calcicola]|uniref:Uncharacterized protein n=1 Tax=Vermiconidia calcicola TaxID=1690605 RepID=A0ACC3MJ87_9PEZI|nr:hypothetical protein LTR37_018028 [Vermiconidia calcicola]